MILESNYFAAAAIGISTLISIIVAFLARDITFFGNKTDNHHHVGIAATLKFTDWPSKMHAGSPGSAAMKVFPVYLLAIFQRLTGNKNGEYPLTLLCIVSNLVSAISVFYIADGYWGSRVALVLTVLFVSSFWPWLLALHGGPICVAQACTLVSVLLFQLGTKIESTSILNLTYIVGGLFLCLSQFSSGSARKYIPLSLAAFFYSHWDTRLPLNSFQYDFINSTSFFVIIPLISLIIFGLLLIKILYRPLIISIYQGRAPKKISSIFDGINHKNFAIDYYLKKGRTIFVSISKLVAYALLYILITTYYFRSDKFYITHSAMVIGVVVGIFLLTYPKIGFNLKLFFIFANADKWNPRFPLYERYFKTIGHPIKTNMRGAGVKWIGLYLIRISPFHLIIFLTLNIIFFVTIFINRSEIQIQEGILILIVSCMPLIVAEVTRAPQLGRSYFPAFLGLLLSIGFTLAAIDKVWFDPSQGLYWQFICIILMLTFIWNAWIFGNDVLPARMGIAKLTAFLKEKNVTELSTYQTTFNNGFLGAVPFTVMEKINVRYISRLGDVSSGLIVVPGTSAKTFNMESERWAIEHGDFKLDPQLNYLIESKIIEKCAVATFKTFGTSRMWGHESEVISYIDLILGLVDDKDRYRGRAWVLDASKISELYNLKNTQTSV
jgi:hypothetical protein